MRTGRGGAARVGALLLVLPLSAQGASAQMSDAGDNEPPWRVRVAPALWRPGLAGHTTAGGGRVDASDVDLTDPTAGFTSDAELLVGDWVFALSGFWFEADGAGAATKSIEFGGAALGAGGAFDSAFSLSSAQATLGRRFRKRFSSADDAAPTALSSVNAHFDLYAGARLYDAMFTLEGAGFAQRSIDGVFAEPIAGAALGLDVFDRASVRVGVDGGGQPFGDHTSASLDVHVAFEIRPTPNVGAFIGWRQIIVDLKTGGDRFENSLAGLFFGVSLRF